jgi:hypothetical protein
MVSVFAFIAVDREFKPQSVQTRDYKIEIWYFPAQHYAPVGIRLVGSESG